MCAVALLPTLLGALVGALPGSARGDERAPLVAVASNAAPAVAAVAERFRADGGPAVRLSAGASGSLVRQVERGAPFELFLSADVARAQRLVDAGLTLDGGAVYAIGRLVLWARTGSPVRTPPTLDQPRDLARALASATRAVALASPEHAPYGQAARAALTRAGIWESLAGRLVVGENVAQAARFAISPDVDAALLPRSLAVQAPLADLGGHVLVPERWHEPLRQQMVLLRGAGPGARAFRDYLLGARAREVFASLGYGLP